MSTLNKVVFITNKHEIVIKYNDFDGWDVIVSKIFNGLLKEEISTRTFRYYETAFLYVENTYLKKRGA